MDREELIQTIRDGATIQQTHKIIDYIDELEQKNYKETLTNNIKVVEHYGVQKQMPVWIEEMSELIKEICKWARKYEQLDGDLNTHLLTNIKEEITDVTICLDQLKYMIHYDEDELMNYYKFKVERQLERIEGEKNDN